MERLYIGHWSLVTGHCKMLGYAYASPNLRLRLHYELMEVHQFIGCDDTIIKEKL